MREINDKFMESYKHLDKICQEIFNTKYGVTAYIEAMEAAKDGARYVSVWDKNFHQLKTMRHIRNRYVHEVGTVYSDICTSSDIQWLNDFCDSILNIEDPLALYRKATTRPIQRQTNQPDVQVDQKESIEKYHNDAVIYVIIIVSIFLILGLGVAGIGIIIYMLN